MSHHQDAALTEGDDELPQGFPVYAEESSPHHESRSFMIKAVLSAWVHFAALVFNFDFAVSGRLGRVAEGATAHFDFDPMILSCLWNVFAIEMCHNNRSH